MEPTEQQRRMIRTAAARMVQHAESENLDPRTLCNQLRWTAALIEAAGEEAKKPNVEEVTA